ncbi:MAG: hydroxymethylbilane synthase [Candidatus Dormibacteria bacterium]
MRLATRGSALARAQTSIAETALRRVGADDIEMVVVRTVADRNPSTPVEELPGQGWFSAELERALLDRRADIAVHSAKDLASELAPGLTIAASLQRDDPRDAAITRSGEPLSELPARSTVATSSTRRVAFLRAMYPALQPVAIRGNVDTRLRKLDEGEADALLLACAGLDRLGLGERITERLDAHLFVPAPAQGAIALETRTQSEAAALARRTDDEATGAAVRAERAVLAALGGGCLLPLGAWARMSEGRFTLTAALAGDDGVVGHCELEGDAADPESLGRRVAAALR